MERAFWVLWALDTVCPDQEFRKTFYNDAWPYSNCHNLPTTYCHSPSAHSASQPLAGWVSSFTHLLA